MLALYLISLGFSSALLGVFAQRVLMGFGYIPTFASGVWMTVAVAAAYAGIQLVALGLLRLAMPTRSTAASATEIASQLATVVLLPYLLGFEIDWPQAALARLEPILYAVLFISAHLFFKLASFYAHLQGSSSKLIDGLALAAAGVVPLVLAIFAAFAWFTEAEGARPQPAEDTFARAADNVFAEGRVMPEGAIYEERPPDIRRPAMSLHWAIPPDEPTRDRLYVSVTMNGLTTETYTTSARFRDGGWAEAHVPHSEMPAGLTRVGVRWTREAPPNWQKIFGIHPIAFSHSADEAVPKNTWMSGPYWHASRPEAEYPNIVILLLDGLGSEHTGALGYDRDVTPTLDRLAYGGMIFTNAEAPAGSLESTPASILTGRRLPPPAGSEPETLAQALQERRYATRLFYETADTRAASPSWAAGFEVTDMRYTGPDVADPESAHGSAKTFERARLWVAKHREAPFFLVVRVRDLLAFQESDADFSAHFGDVNSPRDVDDFDNALRHMDAQVGALLQYIRDRDIRKNTIVVVTSSQGLRFSLGRSGALSERTSRTVPIFINGPGVSNARRARSVHVADIHATLTSLARVHLNSETDSKSLVE